MADDASPTDKPRTDWGQVYLDNAEALTALVGGLDEAQLATTVPGSPDWTVKQVLQHLAGLSSDATSGRMEGAPGDEWTARHTAEREGTSVADLVEELRSNQQGMADAMRSAVASGGFPAATMDIVCHHADLHEALDLGRPPERFWAPVARSVRRRAPAEVAASDVEDYEVFRGAFSRRSREQMSGWGTGADDEALDGMCAFGPREDDQPVPA